MIALWFGMTAVAAPMDSVYLIMVDRFANGNAANDTAVDLNEPTAWHGGDIQGIRNRLDFIEGLGVSTVWLTPITRMRTEAIENHPAWHGYWVADGRSVEGRFGTLKDLQGLQSDLDKRGMGLMLDIVLNHVGPDTPLTQAHPEWFRTNGDVVDWTDDSQRRTHDVHGLPDLDHGLPEVVQHLTKDGVHWARKIAPTAMRIDAVRHIDAPFLKQWIASVQAASPAPLLFAGEVFDGNPIIVANEAKATGLTHSFDFPLHYAITESLCEGGDFRKVPAVLTQDRRYPANHQWITFLDNHDTARAATVCGKQTRAALSLLMSLRGVPSISWGTGQGMTGKSGDEARGDMRFERTELHQFIADRIDERRSFESLTQGETDWLRTTETGLSFARITPNEAMIVSVGDAPKPALPTEAGSPVWLALGDTGIQRWLVTPELGSDFSGWVARIQAETQSTTTLTLAIGASEFAAGSDPAVGGWDPSQAAGPGPVTVALPAGGVVALKTLKQNEDGRPVWSAHPDHFVVVEDFAEGETVTVGH